LIACAAPVSFLLFEHASLEVPVARFLFVLGPAAATALVLRGIVKEREASKTAKALQSYLSPEILRTIIDSDEEIDLKTKRKELTILVADIEHFTAISEIVAPEYLSQYLNEYFEVVTQAVYENKGTVDKFLGDGILAFFGDPSPLENHAMAAVNAAERMLENMTALNAKWAGSGIPQLNEGPNMRVAINTGLVVVGNIGPSRRMEYTAFGAAVNIANQLKYKAPSGGILLTARTRALVKDRIECSEPESIRIKGTDHDIQVYKIAKVI
jgi:class 3 adenylate cyclase